MRKAVVIGIVLALVTMVFAAVPMNVNAAKFTKITPSKGKVGSTAVVHGEGFKGGAVTVQFGTADPVPATVPSDKVGKVKVPNRVATDPNPVPVKLFVDGVLIPGDIAYEYDPAGPEPTITDFNPKSAMVGTEFSIEITGTNFMTPHGRIPDQAALIGPEIYWGSIISYNATTIQCAFPGVSTGGVYEFIVAFSDGSGTNAEGFVVK